LAARRSAARRSKEEHKVGFKLGIGLFTGQIPPGADRTFHDEYRETLELVKLVEEVGLDAAWVSEHHFAEDGYLPSLIPMLAAFAAVTENIELGTGVLLAPFHDPIRIAEDFAVVDQISNGRVICGLGIGWRDEEFREFGIETKSRVRRLSEIVDILRLSWNEERFDYKGRYYSYDGVAVTPKPARVPPIFVGGFVDDAIRRAGRIGDGYISSRATPDRAREAFAIATGARADAGHEGPPMMGILHNAFVTTDPDRDWPMIRAGAGHQLGTYTGWRAGTDLPGKRLEVIPPGDEELRGMTAYGTPDEVIEKLAPLAELLGGYPEGHLVVRLYYPGMTAEPAAEAIRLFADEVAPALRKAASR
jgi:alkanesulfonate monooxygenase SsuD/methylene tetrahydromethanopterin reductase-like flavin-dependent oxidoreductase (luciferase family)